MQYFWLTISCSLLAALWLCLPSGVPGRIWAIISFVPMLFTKGTVIATGQVLVTLLDVGQGLSIVVRTQQHTLVYDTGAKLSDNFDLGSKVVAPYLQTQGINSIDKLLISHVDNDHVGGAEGLISKVHVNEILLNDPNYLRSHAHSSCLAGQAWIWDGVLFQILHPAIAESLKKRNDQSCVLMITAGAHKILLTGDIEAKTELQLIQQYGADLKANILLVPHHGSKTSSSPEFIRAVGPDYALIPVGYKNQYGHPKAEILERYVAAQSKVYRTEYDGAITFLLGAQHATTILEPALYRRDFLGFWLAKDPQISVK